MSNTDRTSAGLELYVDLLALRQVGHVDVELVPLRRPDEHDHYDHHDHDYAELDVLGVYRERLGSVHEPVGDLLPQHAEREVDRARQLRGPARQLVEQDPGLRHPSLREEAVHRDVVPDAAYRDPSRGELEHEGAGGEVDQYRLYGVFGYDEVPRGYLAVVGEVGQHHYVAARPEVYVVEVEERPVGPGGEVVDRRALLGPASLGEVLVVYPDEGRQVHRTAAERR